MPIVYGYVNAPSTTSAPDASNQPFLQGKQGDLIASELHGKYYTQNYRGNVYYSATAPAGVTLTVYSATSYTGHSIWNPAGSGKNIGPIRATVTTVTVGAAMAALGFVAQTGVGAALGTAAPISAYTQVTATRGPANFSQLVAGQGNSVGLVGSAATLTTAPTLFIPLGLSASTGAITTQQTAMGVTEYFDGSIIIPPGTFFGFCQSITDAATWNCSFHWEEVPL